MPTSFDSSLPFNGQAALEDAWRDMFGSWLADGVVAGVDNELAVYGDSTGRQVKVKTGVIRLAGTHGRLTGEKTITLAANSSGNPRIDRIVARAVLTGSEHIELDVLQGTPAGSPTAPALTQTSSVWERSLAQVRCNNAFTTVPPQAVFPTARVAGAPVDERALISLYAAPAFADLAARDLWLPSPKIGFKCADREKGGLWVYDGAGWLQTLRRPFNITYAPSGTEGTGSNATWPVGLTMSVAVPKWATRVRMSAKISKAYAVTGVCNTAVQLLLDTLPVDAGPRIRWDNTLVTSAAADDVMLGGDVDCSALAGTTVVARTLANNVSGSGGVRVDADSICFLEGEFR